MIFTNLFFSILLVSVSAKPFNLFNPFDWMKVSVGVVENVAEASFGVVDDVFSGRSPVQIFDRVLETPGKMVEDIMDDLGVRRTSGIIFLHGLGLVGPLGPMCDLLSGPALGLSLMRNKVSCPKADMQHNDMINRMVENPFGTSKLFGSWSRSWFNFWEMPADSVISPTATEEKHDLEKALQVVEEEIEKMIQEGIPSENIVLAGASQGGALTLYTALHTQYKLGGFIPFVAWLPLLKSESPASLPTPINKDTPILHLNGALDLIVPLNAGWASSNAMKQVFTNYQLKNTASTHLTTINPLNMAKVYCWLKKNVPNMAFSTITPMNFVNILC